MSKITDHVDKSILRILQNDTGLSVDDIVDRVHLPRNAVWRRIKRLQNSGVITKRVALVDPVKAGSPLSAIVLIKTGSHDASWAADLQKAVRDMAEVVGAYRLTGDLDHMLGVRLADMPAYDAFYKRLTSRICVSEISASFVMEDMKDTTAVPL